MTTTPDTNHYSVSEAIADSDANNPDAYQNEYFITVTFRRYLGDDWEPVTLNGYDAGRSVAEALTKQFTAELQEAYDLSGSIVGFFHVDSIKLESK